MIASLGTQARYAWTTVNRQETVVLMAVTTVAYSVFGKKALFALASFAGAAFYCRKFITLRVTTLVSAVISLPLCGFLGSPLIAAASGLFLTCYILKNENDQQKLITALQKEITERKKDTQAVQTNTELAQAVISSLSQFITTTRKQTDTLMQIESQERQTMQLAIDMLSNSELQEKLALARAANETFKHLATDLGAIPVQAETAFHNLQLLNARLWEVIEILQTIIAQRTQPPLPS